jgi:succinate dehydrogenase / fumarate reductase cytochrome b subunit
MTERTIPQTFLWRRLHSLFGLWLVLFLLEHLLTNSQAALLLGENGQGFVRMVNLIHDLPYLPAIEIFLLGTPIAFHAALGIKYALTAKSNASKTDGSKPSLGQYGRNRAYSWQRITSWVLLFGIIGHVVKFRFIEYPVSVSYGKTKEYFVKVKVDPGLYSVASRLGVTLYDAASLQKEKQMLASSSEQDLLQQYSTFSLYEGVPAEAYSYEKKEKMEALQNHSLRRARTLALTKKEVNSYEVIAATESFGTATLLSVRDTFKSPLYVILYTLFVLAASFHAFNGLWTFMISWGLIFRQAAQKSMVRFCIAVMAVIAMLGLAAIWGTFWLNLRY